MNITPYYTRKLFGGTQKLYKFDNGYGASVVSHNFSYGGSAGLWELGVTIFTSDSDWELVYETPITDDVIGYLTEDEVQEILQQIKDL